MVVMRRQESTRPQRWSQQGSCLNGNIHLPLLKPSLVPRAGCLVLLPASSWALPSLLEEEHGRCSGEPIVARSCMETCDARFELM